MQFHHRHRGGMANAVTVVTTAVVCCFSASTRAQSAQSNEATEKGPPAVIVTGTGPQYDPSLTLPNLDTARQRLNAIAGGANVIDGDSFRQGRVSTLADALSYSPGVIAQPRFGAEEARLSIRGSGLQRTFHLRGIKLMQDGVPLNLADGSGDFQAIEPLHTRYIEVFRGANALQHGVSTLGGAINYVSVTGHDHWPALARFEAGSFEYLRSQVSVGGVKGDLDWMGTFSTFSQDGFRVHSRQAADRATGNIGYRINPDLETRFFLSIANSDSELPGSLTKAQLNADPRQANAATAASHQKRDIDWLRLSNKTVWSMGSSRLEFLGYYSDKTLFHPIFQVLDQMNSDYGGELRWVGDGAWLGRRNRFTAGFSLSRGTISDKRSVNQGGYRGARTNELQQVAANTELYVENAHYLWEHTALVLGVQAVRNRRKSKDLFIAAGEGDESFDARYSATSPKIGVLHELSKDVQLFANVSRSHEPPSFGELSGGLRPNINAAQKGTTYEVGGRGTLRDLSWDVALYQARLRDELLQTQVSVAGNAVAAAPQTVNVTRTVHSGLELGTGGRIFANTLRHFEWRQALVLNRFRFDGDPAFGNNQLPGLPRALLKGEVLYRDGGFYAGVNLAWSPQSFYVDMANTFSAEAWSVWGAKVGQRISASWSWFVEGRNLGNRKYASDTGVTRTQAGLDGALFLPGDGRSIFAGVEWRL